MIIINKESNTDILVSDATKAFKEYHLNSLEIDVTNKCPCHCQFCFLGNNHEEFHHELSYNKINDLLLEAKELGVYYVSFSGGEPFARRDFLDILKCAKKMGFFVSFVSSLQIPSKEIIMELGDIGISRVLVSFHSADPERYSQIFGVNKEIYYRALDNIKTLIESETPIGISVTTFCDNCDELNEIRDLFTGMGIKEEDVHFNVLIEGKNKIQTLRGETSLCDYLKNNKHLKKNVLSKTRTHETSFLCSAGRSALVIRPDGTAVPCGFSNIIAGDVNKQTLSDVWTNSGVLKMIRSIKEEHFEKCKGCPEVDTCPVCMATNINETGNPFIPSEDYCRFHTKINHSFIKSEEYIYED